MNDKTKPYKAVVAGVVALGGTLTAALTDGGITTSEWITAVVTTVVAVGATYGITNPPA